MTEQTMANEPDGDADTTSDRDYEGEARAVGWKPEAEFKGKPGRWKTAEDFIHLREESLPLMQSLLAEKDKEYNDRLAGLEKAANSALAAAQSQHDKTVTDLQGQLRYFASQGDLNSYDRANAQLTEAVKAAPQIAPVASEKEQADEKFARDNPWYGVDKKLTSFAMGESMRLLQESPSMTIAANRRMTAEAVRQEFPEKFQGNRLDPDSPSHARVDGGSAFPSGPRSNRKGGDSLPSEVKAIGQKFVTQGLFKTLDDYAKEYYAGIDSDGGRRRA